MWFSVLERDICMIIHIKIRCVYMYVCELSFDLLQVNLKEMILNDLTYNTIKLVYKSNYIIRMKKKDKVATP